jgi:hypothetical protein
MPQNISCQRKAISTADALEWKKLKGSISLTKGQTLSGDRG